MSAAMRAYRGEPQLPFATVGHPSDAANRALGRRVQAGRAARNSLEARGEAIGGPERETLLRVVRSGLEAAEELAVGNVRLAVDAGRKKSRKSGRDMEDAVSDALVGLIRAAATYDPDTHDTQFSTHAVWRIRGSLGEGGRRDPAVHQFPDGRCVFWGYGPEMSDEIRTRMAVRDDDIDRDEDVDDATVRVRHLLDRLTPREAEVIAMRYGLGGGGVLTLADVGAALGVTRERVRQIQARAMEKLRRKQP